MFTELIDDLINLKTLETHLNIAFWLLVGVVTFREPLGIGDGWEKWLLVGFEILMVVFQFVTRHFYNKKVDQLRKYEKENLKNH